MSIIQNSSCFSSLGSEKRGQFFLLQDSFTVLDDVVHIIYISVFKGSVKDLIFNVFFFDLMICLFGHLEYIQDDI